MEKKYLFRVFEYFHGEHIGIGCTLISSHCQCCTIDYVSAECASRSIFLRSRLSYNRCWDKVIRTSRHKRNRVQNRKINDNTIAIYILRSVIYNPQVFCEFCRFSVTFLIAWEYRRKQLNAQILK